MMDEMRALGFDCEWIRYDDAHRKRGMIRALPKIWRLIRKYRPDVVHCNLFDDSLPGLVAARFAGVKVRVLTRQDTGFHWFHRPRWVFLDRWNARMATHVIAISGECREFLIEKEGVPREKVKLVHNGIPPERFTRQDPLIMKELRGRFGLEGRYPVIGTVARFIKWKGYDRIVEAARKLVVRHPNIRFLFCGTGPQEQEIRSRVKEYGLTDHIVFTGWLDRASMPSFYGVLDAYLHAAHMEPFGLVFAEAMMNRVPVVTTPTGAARDAIKDGENGILIKDGSPEAIVDAIDRLLATDRSAMGERGCKTALEKFPFDVMWNGTMKVYEQALAEQG